MIFENEKSFVLRRPKNCESRDVPLYGDDAVNIIPRTHVLDKAISTGGHRPHG